jgi:uncharacterized phiE125 gp8 family phage protein
MNNIQVITPQSGTAVTLADFHNHIKVSDTSEDALYTFWINAATELYTLDTQEVLLTQTLRLNLDNFPGQLIYRPSYMGQAYYYNQFQNQPANQVIYIPRYPVTAVSSVEYLDTNATWQTLAGTSVDLTNNPARVILPSTLPNLHPSQFPKVRVNFTAGYANAASIPATTNILIKLICAHWYDQRQETTTDDLKDIPFGFKAIVSQRRLNVRTDWNC